MIVTRLFLQDQSDKCPPRNRKRKEAPRRAIVSTRVSTRQERKLFFELLEEHNPEGRTEVGWSRMTAAWNTYVSDRLNEGSSMELVGINPKTPFHLRDFFKEHTRKVEVQQAINFSPALREEHAALNNTLGARVWSSESPAQVVPSFQYAPTPLFIPQHPGLQYPPAVPQAAFFSVPMQAGQPPVYPTAAHAAGSRFVSGQHQVDVGRGSNRGGKGKGKVCTRCGKPTLGHKKKSCD